MSSETGVVAPKIDAGREQWASTAGEDLACAYDDDEPDYGPGDPDRP